MIDSTPAVGRWIPSSTPSLGLVGAALAALALAAAAGSLRRRGPARRSTLFADGSLLLSLAGIAALTLGPTRGDHEVHLVPMHDIVSALGLQPRPAALAGLVGNLLLFSPLGAAAYVRGYSLRRAGLVACGTSLGVETIQLWVPGRTTSTDDVLLNVLGALLGFAAFALSARRARNLGR